MLHRRGSASALIVVTAAFLSGCGGAEPAEAPRTANPDPAAIQATASGLSSKPTPASGLSGKVVLIDPGHNGGNSRASAVINRGVPDGRGHIKPCNTTGTQTSGGYTEHAFNWNVAQELRRKLEARGVVVKMTRESDTGVGPCVDVRGKMPEKLGVDAAVSIHADGAAPSGHGFHVIYSSPPLAPSQGRPSLSLATAVRNALRSAGFATSSYIGHEGLSPRSDLGGLNFARKPAVMVECGNMRNVADAAELTTPEQQARIATAISDGVIAWLSSA